MINVVIKALYSLKLTGKFFSPRIIAGSEPGMLEEVSQAEGERDEGASERLRKLFNLSY
jgi:hypothetical protein